MSFLSSGREIPESDGLYWRLSALLARKFYSPLKLFADSKSADWLIKKCGIKFDEVDTTTITRDTQGANPMCWSAGKLAAMRSMASEGKPFFHIDGDAFVFRALSPQITHAPMFAQCIEKRLKRNTARYKKNTHYPINELLPHLHLPNFMERYLNRRSQPVVNMGIFGGIDCRSIYEYADIALRTFVYSRHNNSVMRKFQRQTNHWLGIAAIAEQWSLAAYCYWKGITPVTIMDRIDSFNLNRAHEVGGYIHLFSCVRRLPQYRKWAKRKLKELLSEPTVLPLAQAA